MSGPSIFELEAKPLIRAVRGATTVEEDTAASIRAAVGELLEALTSQNRIAEPTVICVLMSVTPDLHAISPAKVTREVLNWSHTPMMCSLEPVIEGLPARCVRVLIQYESDTPREALKMVYLKGARQLRPDLV